MLKKIWHNVGPKQQAWVSWSAGVLLRANMGEQVFILRMLAVLFSGTQITIRGTTPTRDVNAKHGLGKTTNLHKIAILEATLHKEGIGKEW